MTTLTIGSSFFAIPGGSKIIQNVNLGNMTIGEIKKQLAEAYPDVCPLPLLNLWWNGYLLPSPKSILSACVGVDDSERVPADTKELMLFLTVQELNPMKDPFSPKRERKSSFDIRLQEYKSKDAPFNCVLS
ncbi:hypothetical protein TrLO_g487 [Triparma laevis f. longispina]|uniref:Uncharacterized protein n=1 Tax=Triparma laevis f. longispina TaxID=1714387 RepID=A0A9W7C0M7_9STRA|nr:hypothetical protein TrLO_g487 [Triparma laevis f. longispina]